MPETKALATNLPASSRLQGFSLAGLGEIAVPIAVLAIVMALVMPVPPFLLDVLIVVNLMMSVIVMMVSLYVSRPVEFSVFPTTLLLLTLFRLALNVSSSRLILLDGNTGTKAAGHVIEAFGIFVVGGNYIIGSVIFLVLIAIQYVVINHGAVRISEVTARFTLDAMPGKQMSIDAEMNAGLIDEAEARSRRKNLSLEAEFYGAMDGASRFTQRDAVASILITIINIAAGFLIGVFQYGMDLRRALETYTVLTIGDGLVTVIPALMISVSGGLVVTRGGSDTRLSADFQRQLFGNANLLLLASVVSVGLSALPGLPTFPFLALGGGLGALAWRIRQRAEAREAAARPQQAKALTEAESLESLLRTEPLSVEVGLGLVHLVEGGAESPLMKRIAAIRRQIATEMGYLLPPIRVNDNLTLKPREYMVQLRGAEIARYELVPGHELGIQADKVEPALHGRATKEPAFGIDAFWISKDNIEKALHAGYAVVDHAGILGTHLIELVRRHANEMFSRQDAKNYCDRVARESPKVIEDLVPKTLSLAVVQKVVQNLLRERVSIRDGVGILEALGEAATMTKNTVLLTEYVRQSIRRTLVKNYLDAKGELQAYFVDPSLERPVETAVEHGEFSSSLGMNPQAMRDLLERFRKRFPTPQASAVVVTSSGARYFVRQILETTLPSLTLLSHNEIPADVTVRSRGLIE
jgi:flagellar biosynthesis protein FlhA